MSSICAIRDSGHDSRKRRKGDSRVQPRAGARARRGGGYFAIIRLSCDFLLANRLSVEGKEGKGDGLALLLQSEAQSTAMDEKGGK